MLSSLFLLTLSLLLPTASSSYASNNVGQCCERLSRKYQDRLIWPDNHSYSQHNERWTENAQLESACIFLPTSPPEVADAVRIFHSPAEHGGGSCPFAVKSGGHMPHAGANDIDGGVVLDLRNLNQVTIARDRSFVSLGAGNTWGQVYKRLRGTNLAVPGGRCAGTGVGGVVLGGGYSWLMPKVGWVADNVVEYEVVTAAGEILDVGRASHPELFRALKGGASNFGIVTRFDVATFEHDQRFRGGYIAMPINATGRVLKAFDGLVQLGGEDEDASVAVEFVLQRRTGESRVLMWVTATAIKGEHPSLRAFEEMQEEGVESTYGLTTFADYPGGVPPVPRVLFATTTIKASSNFSLDTLKEVHKIATQVYDDCAHIPNLTWDLQYEPLLKAYRDRRGNHNVLGLNHINDDLIIVFLMPLWKNARYDEDVHAAVQTWLDRMHEYTSVQDVGCPFEYLNYAAPFQNPLASYGASNVKFLRNVARRYDPGGFFQKAMPDGFKLE